MRTIKRYGLMGNMEDAHYVMYALDAACRAGLASETNRITSSSDANTNAEHKSRPVRTKAAEPLSRAVKLAKLDVEGGTEQRRSSGCSGESSDSGTARAPIVNRTTRKIGKHTDGARDEGLGLGGGDRKRARTKGGAKSMLTEEQDEDCLDEVRH